jgi:hypothetical protein
VTKQVESAKLMRQAADILSSAPAMQIRYLESMQAIAKTAGTKVIFLPGANQSMLGTAGFKAMNDAGDSSVDFGGQDPGFQQAINARIIENI